MNKSNHVVGNVKIYPISYLMNKELSESDLCNLFDSPSLKYSIIIGMFRQIKNKRRNADIINMCKKNPRWMYDNQWSKKDFDEYEQKIINVIKNIYSYKDTKATAIAQNYMVLYGLQIKDNKIDLSL